MNQMRFRQGCIFLSRNILTSCWCFLIDFSQKKISSFSQRNGNILILNAVWGGSKQGRTQSAANAHHNPQYNIPPDFVPLAVT